MRRQFFFHAVICFMICVCQISLISGLPYPFSSISLVSILIIFVLILRGVNLALLWVFFVGFIFDIISFYFFGMYLIIYVFAFIVTNFFYTGYFTDKSLYSILILQIIFFTIVDFEILVIDYFFKLLGYPSYELFFTQKYVQEYILNLIVVVCIFYTLSLFLRDLKPIFLVTNLKKL